MRTQDIVINTKYRLKSSPNYGYVKALAILKANENENTNNYVVVKCEHTVDCYDTFGFIRYFRLCDIIKDV